MEGGRTALNANGSPRRAGRRKDGRQRPHRASSWPPACYAAATQLTELPVWRRSHKVMYVFTKKQTTCISFPLSLSDTCAEMEPEEEWPRLVAVALAWTWWSPAAGPCAASPSAGSPTTCSASRWSGCILSGRLLPETCLYRPPHRTHRSVNCQFDMKIWILFLACLSSSTTIIWKRKFFESSMD